MLWKPLLALILIMLIDFPWLYLQGNTTKHIVERISGRSEYRLWAAIPVYIALTYILLQQTSLAGSFFIGISVYAVYDFTTLFIFRDYPLDFAVMDTLWGGVLFASSYYILNRIIKS
jgi:uncharacterized membrane protein